MKNEAQKAFAERIKKQAIISDNEYTKQRNKKIVAHKHRNIGNTKKDGFEH